MRYKAHNLCKHHQQQRCHSAQHPCWFAFWPALDAREGWGVSSNFQGQRIVCREKIKKIKKTQRGSPFSRLRRVARQISRQLLLFDSVASLWLHLARTRTSLALAIQPWTAAAVRRPRPRHVTVTQRARSRASWDQKKDAYTTSLVVPYLSSLLAHVFYLWQRYYKNFIV